MDLQQVAGATVPVQLYSLIVSLPFDLLVTHSLVTLWPWESFPYPITSNSC